MIYSDFLVAGNKMENRPVVGVALIVRKNNQILLHKRIGKHAPGTWSCPGGHLEMWEEFAEAALRELKEEAGPVEVTEPFFLTACNTMFKSEDKHSITVFMVCDWISGEPEVTEPEKCEQWMWFSYDNLPEPLMLGVQKIKDNGTLKAILTKPYDCVAEFDGIISKMPGNMSATTTYHKDRASLESTQHAEWKKQVDAFRDELVEIMNWLEWEQNHGR